jgi:hypothetical protein
VVDLLGYLSSDVEWVFLVQEHPSDSRLLLCIRDQAQVQDSARLGFSLASHKPGTDFVVHSAR